MIKQKKGEGDDQFKERRGSPIMVAFDSHSRSIIAHYVVKKGVNPYSIKLLKMFIERLGYKKMLYKTDQESSVTALLAEVAKPTHVQLVPEEAKAYDES